MKHIDTFLQEIPQELRGQAQAWITRINREHLWLRMVLSGKLEITGFNKAGQPLLVKRGKTNE